MRTHGRDVHPGVAVFHLKYHESQEKPQPLPGQPEMSAYILIMRQQASQLLTEG